MGQEGRRQKVGTSDKMLISEFCNKILQLVNLSKEYMDVCCTLFFNSSLDLNIFTIKIVGKYSKKKLSLEKQ